MQVTSRSSFASQRLIKDSITDSSKINKSLRLPLTTTTEQPAKGAFIYDVASEIGDSDGILFYADGSKWIPLASSSSLIAGPGISIVTTGGNITISSTVTLSNIGTDPNGVLIPLSPQLGPDFTVRGLIPGSGVSLTATDTDIIITNTNTSQTSNLSSAGGTETLVNNGTGPNLVIKGLTAGSGIALTPSATDITISSALTFSSIFYDNNSTTSYQIPSNAIDASVTIFAGGGGGGGVSTGGSYHGGGGGGGSGGSVVELPLKPNDIVNWSIGVGGAGGSYGPPLGGSGNPGAFGNSTTFYITRGADNGPLFNLGGGGPGGGGSNIGGPAGAGPGGAGGANNVPIGYVGPFGANGSAGGSGGYTFLGGNAPASAGGAYFGSPFAIANGGLSDNTYAGGGGGGSTWLGVGGHGMDNTGGSATNPIRPGGPVYSGGGGGYGGGGPSANGGRGANGCIHITYWS